MITKSKFDPYYPEEWIKDEYGEVVDWWWILNDEHYNLWSDAGDLAIEIDSKGNLRTIFPFNYENYPNELKLEVILKKKTDETPNPPSVEFSISILEEQWWHHAESMDGGCTSDWFGSFRLYDFDWIYHAQLGWVNIHPDGAGGFWLWLDDHG